MLESETVFGGSLPIIYSMESESAAPHSPPTFSREVRLGLVTYSGISLSIYTSGICQEFYQAVRGRGIYKLLKALIDADIVVDTLSGTSMGGINGVLLSYALTNSTETETVDFQAFQEVWQSSGDIYQLLRQSPAAASALLDDESSQQQQLEAAFVNAFQYRVPPPASEWVSPVRELDLFITGTDFWGKTYRTFDGSEAVTEVQDHRGLFHLKHRQGRKEPFNPLRLDLVGAKPQHTFQALAKLCRLTAALPAVFPMVQVDLNNPKNVVDRQLGIWGQLDQRSWQHRREGKQISFLDGSLLDNAPFMPATRAMHYRTLDRWTQRILFYTDPSPQKWSEPADPQNALQSSAPQLVRARILDIPMYHSVVTDLRHLQEHNQKVQRYQELLAHAEASLHQPLQTTELQLQNNIYLRSRLINLRTQVLPQLLCLVAGSDSSRQPELERIAWLLTHHYVDQAAKEQREECLQDFAPQMTQLDVDYSLRQHFYLTHKIHEQLMVTSAPNERFYLEILIKQIGQSIQLLEVIKAGLHQLLSNVVISDNFYAMLGVKKSDNFLRPLIYEYIFRLHRYFLDVQALSLLFPEEEQAARQDGMMALSELFINLPLTANELTAGWLPTEQISMVWQQLQQKVEIVAAAASQGHYIWNKNRFHYDQRGNQCFLSMLTQIESATTMLLYNSPTTAARSLLHQFQSFEQLDRVLYPFEYLTDLKQKEPLATVQISPALAQLGWSQGKLESEKLAGNNFYVTGGLFNVPWRANDLLWGRLDGLNKIFEGLVSPLTVKCFSGFVQRESMQLSLTTDSYLEFLLDESLPQVVGQERQQLKAHLVDLVQPGLAVTVNQLQAFLQDVVMAGHRQLITTDLNRVWRSTVVQQQAWGNQTSQALTQDPLKSSTMKMAQEITSESLRHLTTVQEHFFRQQYKVGSAKLFENTPGMIWVNWTSQLVLALRDGLVKFWGKRRVDQTSKNSVYRSLGLKSDRLLQDWYWWLQSQGTKLVLKISLRPLRLMLRSLLVMVLILAVLLTTFNPWWWVVVELVSLVSWGLAQRRRWLGRFRPQPLQKLLAMKSLVDR
jgi:patatin-related protein